MKRGKPIEPGCLAMIVGASVTPENNDKVVRVIERAYSGYKEPGEPRGITYVASASAWIIRTTDGAKTLITRTNKGRSWRTEERAMAEKALIRLDDDEEPKAVTRTVTKDLDQVI